MTTVAEKQATYGTLLDDIATTLLSFAEWQEADATITNDQTDDNWRNNARVLQNTTAGHYLLIWLHDPNQDGNRWGYGEKVSALRVTISNDWDSTNHVPAGNTTVVDGDPWDQDVANHVTESFTTEHSHGTNNSINTNGNTNFGPGVSVFDSNVSNGRADVAALDVTYFLASDGSYLTVGAWNTTDGNNGEASALMYDYVDNKFWNDGQLPVQITEWRTREIVHHYAFSDYFITRNSDARFNLGRRYDRDGTLQEGDWGMINPDSGDDTFFFRRPVIYTTKARTTPVAYLDSAITNDRNGGASHGDTVTHDGVNYRIMDQSGRHTDSNYAVTLGLRYE